MLAQNRQLMLRLIAEDLGISKDMAHTIVRNDLGKWKMLLIFTAQAHRRAERKADGNFWRLSPVCSRTWFCTLLHCAVTHSLTLTTFNWPHSVYTVGHMQSMLCVCILPMSEEPCACPHTCQVAVLIWHHSLNFFRHTMYYFAVFILEGGIKRVWVNLLNMMGYSAKNTWLMGLYYFPVYILECGTKTVRINLLNMCCSAKNTWLADKGWLHKTTKWAEDCRELAKRT